jgi:D-proline reductase (dithiol) PrdB
MCHQTVGLVQGEIEAAGMVTASLTMLPEITRKVQPPRALEVPYPLGFPLGRPGDADLHRRILRSLLEMCQDGRAESVPRIEPLREAPTTDFSQSKETTKP